MPALSNLHQNYPIEDYSDRFDLREIVRIIWKKKWLVLAVVLIGIACAVAYNSLTTPQYRSTSTFFIPFDETNSSASSALAGYAKMLGGGNSSDLKSSIEFLSQSSRIRLTIAEALLPQLKPKIELAIKTGKIKKASPEIKKFVLGSLRLHQLKVTQQENGLYTVSYFHPDRYLAYQGVRQYYVALNAINQDLGITGRKKIVEVLDEPEVAESPFKPQKKQVLIIAIAVSFIFGVFLAVLVSLFEKPAS